MQCSIPREDNRMRLFEFLIERRTIFKQNKPFWEQMEKKKANGHSVVLKGTWTSVLLKMWTDSYTREKNWHLFVQSSFLF